MRMPISRTALGFAIGRCTGWKGCEWSENGQSIWVTIIILNDIDQVKIVENAAN